MKSARKMMDCHILEGVESLPEETGEIQLFLKEPDVYA